MKYNTYNQHIWWGAALVLNLLLHVSCDSCRSAALERGTDPVIATIKFNKSNVTAYVNGLPVVEVQGEITENRISGNAGLWLLVVPTNKGREEVKDIIRAFQTKKQGLGAAQGNVPRIDLITKTQVAHYIKDIAGSEKSIVSARVFVDQLSSGAYAAYLLLACQDGTVFSNAQPLKVPLSPAELNLCVTMGTATAEKDPVLGQIKVNADATHNCVNVNTEVNGFIFIEKGLANGPKKLELVNDLIKDGKNLSPGNQFKSVANGQAIVAAHAAVDQVIKLVNEVGYDAKDPTKQLFKMGSTYTVDSWLCFKDADGIPNYIVSNDSKEMTIPKPPEVALSIEKVEITELIKYLDAITPDGPGNQLSIHYTAKIDKCEDVSTPRIGLLFVRGAAVSQQDGISKITTLLNTAPVKGYYCQNEDAVYLIGNINQLDDTISADFIPLTLGETYHVYFFLKDGGGDIFLSTNDVPLIVPKVDLAINLFCTGIKLKDFYALYDNPQVSITPVKLPDGCDIIMKGYGIYPEGEKEYTSVELWRKVLQGVNKSPLSPTFDHGKVTLMDVNQMDGNIATFYTDSYGDQTPQGSTYDICLFAACKNAVFYKTTTDPKHKFIWYNALQSVPDALQVFEYKGTRYRIVYISPKQPVNRIYAEEKDVNGAIIEKVIYRPKLGNENTPDGKATLELLKGILALAYIGPSQKEDIEDFISKMEEGH